MHSSPRKSLFGFLPRNVDRSLAVMNLFDRGLRSKHFQRNSWLERCLEHPERKSWFATDHAKAPSRNPTSTAVASGETSSVLLASVGNHVAFADHVCWRPNQRTFFAQGVESEDKSPQRCHSSEAKAIAENVDESNRQCTDRFSRLRPV